MTDRTHWPLRACQSRALCVLTENWQQTTALCPPLCVQTLEALKRRGLVESTSAAVWWRLTEIGIREARRYGSIAAVSKETGCTSAPTS